MPALLAVLCAIGDGGANGEHIEGLEAEKASAEVADDGDADDAAADVVAEDELGPEAQLADINSPTVLQGVMVEDVLRGLVQKWLEGIHTNVEVMQTRARAMTNAKGTVPKKGGNMSMVEALFCKRRQS